MSIETTSDTTANDDAKDLSFKLPGGGSIHYIPGNQEGCDIYTIELLDKNGKVFGRICACNGVSKECTEKKVPNCDCTKTPPDLKCD